ncbi:MAG: hypothetical protein ACREDK_03320 [Thermoplasmata archaeon]
MSVPGLSEIAAELQRLGVRYVVVGGGAVARAYAVATEDVDVLVAAEDYATTLAKLRKSPMVGWVEDSPRMATVRFNLEGGKFELDVIDTTMYSGNKEPDAFVRYVRSHASKEVHGVRYASVPAVWYMRLACPDWQVYTDKVQRDIAFGVPAALLDDATAIGQRFGLGAKIRDRAGIVRQGLLDADRAFRRRE